MKRTLALLLLLYNSSLFAQVNLNQGLVAYYPFNGNTNDVSGNGLNGIPRNGVQLTTDKYGNPNSAYYFDGIDDYIEVLDDPKLRFRDSFSICLLFNRDPTGSSTAELIEKRLWSDGSASSFDFGLVNAAQVRTAVKVGDNCPDPLNGWIYPTISNSTNTNEWYCVVTTFNQGQVNFYLDGSLIGTGTTLAKIDSCVGSSMRIGIHWSLDLLPFKGKIDEVRIYNRAINRQEISSLCNLCNQPKGTIVGETICQGETGNLVFNPSIGLGPFSIQYTDGVNLFTQNNVTGGNPFSLATNYPTATTSYILRSVTDATGCTSAIGFSADTAKIIVQNCTSQTATASFTAPDTICVNTPMQITNTSIGAMSYYWNFCVANTNLPPIGTNIGNVGGQMQKPVYIDYTFDNGNYYGFVTNNSSAGLLRLDFGNSLLNAPTVTSLGTIGGIIPQNTEGLQIVNNEGKWYVIIVGGDPIGSGNISRIVKVELGINIANNSPVATDWGNIGILSYPHDLYIFKDNGNWYGFTVNYDNSTITKFNFTNSFSNTPTGVNLGNIGNLNGPTGLHAINDNGNWSLFVTNALSSTLTRVDFGNSLLNIPTAQNLGNPGGLLHTCWDIFIMKFCGETTAFVINADQAYNDLVRLSFGSDITSIPTGKSFGNIGNCLFPHCLSKIFRVGSDLYSFITNVDNNTLTRLQFTGCTNSNTPNSTLQNPPPVTYNLPGVYNINLSIDDGLPTQSTFCKQVVVQSCKDTIINSYTPVLAFNPCNNKITVGDASAFNVGDTVLMIQMKGAVIDSGNTSGFGSIINYQNAGNYEFNYIKSISGNIVEFKNVLVRRYDVPDGKVQLIRVPYYQNITFNSTLTCLPWDGSKGGVVVLNVQDTLTLNADIDVSKKGFRGGNSLNTNNLNWTCGSQNYFYPYNSVEGAAKGEGITQLSPSKSNGKGPQANGGGGANQSNAGGGGGGNGGSGGYGGNEFEYCTNSFDDRGIGGKNLIDPFLNKIFLGGGGGAGDANNPPPNDFSSFGGNGGGIIIVNTNSLSGLGHRYLKANGADGLECNTGNCFEGMGGGGAAGTILLNVNKYYLFQPLSMEVKGGKGADAVHTLAQSSYKHGPGGGGGGGVIFLSATVMPVGVDVNTNGGISGVNINYSNDPWGATSGQNGVTLFNLSLPIDNILFKTNIDSVRIKDTVTGCASFNFNGLSYTNTSPIVNWQWNFGDGTKASTKDTSHAYALPGTHNVKLVVSDVNGCKDSISKNIFSNKPSFDFNYEFNKCDPFSVQFIGIGNDTLNPYWSFGDGTAITGNLTPIHVFSAAGNYDVRYAVTNGTCTDTLLKTITVGVAPENLILTSDTTICFGNSKRLLTKPVLSFCWNPTTYLDNANSPNPITSTPQNITYYFTAQVTGQNIITNGDFNAGNSGFSSEYHYNNNNTTEGEYFVGTNPAAWNAALSGCTDHAGSGGKMMMINGSPVANAKVWTQTITVSPNTNYAFSTWIQSLILTNPAQLQFSINGNNLGNLITASSTPCNWAQFYTTWNSGSNTTATIAIVNKNTEIQGNDFALDDISFAPVFSKRDSVVISVEKPVVTAFSDTTVCPGKQVPLNAIGAANYLWVPSAGLNNSNIANPIAVTSSTAQYIVTGTTTNGCSAKDTVNISIYPKPVITKTSDTAICKNSSVQLFISGGNSYSWTPPGSLNNNSVSNPTANPIANTTYQIRITDANNCVNNDSIKVSIRPDPIFAVNSSANLCLNSSMQLNASGGNLYSWQPTGSLNNSSISDPTASPQNTTKYSVLITDTVCNNTSTLTTTVTVLSLPTVKANKSTDLDCSHDFSQLNAVGGMKYEWSPATTLNSSNIANPIARPTLKTVYTVKGTDVNGCANYDSIMVDITDLNKSGYFMPSAFTPNNDGLNDCYGIKYWGIIEELDFSIYNRWGERIFHTTTPGDCWDGKYKGVQQNPDVYVYLITAKTFCGKVFRKGTFTLIR